jgi:hypothetical protein
LRRTAWQDNNLDVQECGVDFSRPRRRQATTHLSASGASRSHRDAGTFASGLIAWRPRHSKRFAFDLTSPSNPAGLFRDLGHAASSLFSAGSPSFRPCIRRQRQARTR